MQHQRWRWLDYLTLEFYVPVIWQLRFKCPTPPSSDERIGDRTFCKIRKSTQTVWEAASEITLASLVDTWVALGTWVSSIQFHLHWNWRHKLLESGQNSRDYVEYRTRNVLRWFDYLTLEFYVFYSTLEFQVFLFLQTIMRFLTETFANYSSKLPRRYNIQYEYKIWRGLFDCLTLEFKAPTVWHLSSNCVVHFIRWKAFESNLHRSHRTVTIPICF